MKKTTLILFLSISLLVVTVWSQDIRYEIIETKTFILGAGETVIAWNPDDTRIAVSNSDNVFICFITDECTPLSKDVIPIVTSLSWHPSEEMLATSGNRFNLWNTLNGENISILDFPQNEATEGVVQWSNNGGLLAFTTSELFNEGQSYTINLWTLAENIFTEIPYEINTGLHTIEWSEDDELIAISDFAQVSFWNQSLNEITFTLTNYSNIYDICSDSTNTEFLFGAWTLDNRINSIYVLNETDDEPSNLGFTFESAISSIDCNPVYNNIVSIGTLDGVVTIIDIDTQDIILIIDSNERDNLAEITGLAWNAGGDKLAVGNNLGFVVIYSLNIISEN